MSNQQRLRAAARKLAVALKERDLQIVFAESCTAGLVSATLGAFPGISAYHCGSAVVYQVDTKAQWLGIPRTLLKTPGPVSKEVAAEMAKRVLAKTPKADVGVSVTGHLGPDAPKKQDGMIITAVALRARRGRRAESHHFMALTQLPKTESGGSSPARQRAQRQLVAARFVLDFAHDVITRHA
jgi:PncC family amidohydrolase